jgi:hypothetical protein
MEEKPKLTFRREGDEVRVDAVASCGDRFIDVAIVYNVNCDNPILELPEPLGVSVISQIMRWIGEQKGN